MTIPPGYIEASEAATRLGITPECVRRMLDRGDLTECKMPGSRRRFVTEKSLQRRMAAQTEGATK